MLESNFRTRERAAKESSAVPRSRRAAPQMPASFLGSTCQASASMPAKSIRETERRRFMKFVIRSFVGTSHMRFFLVRRRSRTQPIQSCEKESKSLVMGIEIYTFFIRQSNVVLF